MNSRTRSTPISPETIAARSESEPSVGDTFCTVWVCSCTGSAPLLRTRARFLASDSLNDPEICTPPLNDGWLTVGYEMIVPSSSIAS